MGLFRLQKLATFVFRFCRTQKLPTCGFKQLVRGAAKKELEVCCLFFVLFFVFSRKKLYEKHILMKMRAFSVVHQQLVQVKVRSHCDLVTTRVMFQDKGRIAVPNFMNFRKKPPPPFFQKTMLRFLQQNFSGCSGPTLFLYRKSATKFFGSEITPPPFGSFPKIHVDRG